MRQRTGTRAAASEGSVTCDVGTLYTVYQDDNSYINLDPECAPLVDRAMKLWADSGHTRDSWITVQNASGGEFCLLASRITSTVLTTAQQRQDTTMRDKAFEDERAEFRRLAGYIESE